MIFSLRLKQNDVTDQVEQTEFQVDVAHVVILPGKVTFHLPLRGKFWL